VVQKRRLVLGRKRDRADGRRPKQERRVAGECFGVSDERDLLDPRREVDDEAVWHFSAAALANVGTTATRSRGKRNENARTNSKKRAGDPSHIGERIGRVFFFFFFFPARVCVSKKTKSKGGTGKKKKEKRKRKKKRKQNSRQKCRARSSRSAGVSSP
jgi:hypothetical protein